MSTGYDSSGNPTSLASQLWPYVAQLSYTNLGQPQTYRMGPSTTPVYTIRTYDPQTGNLDTTATQAGSTPVTVDDDVYHYNDALGVVTCPVPLQSLEVGAAPGLAKWSMIVVTTPKGRFQIAPSGGSKARIAETMSVLNKAWDDARRLTADQG